MSIYLAITILIAIESSGDPSAIGDGGKAVGILQMHQIAVREANRICELNGKAPRFSYDDRFDREKSIEMCSIILVHRKKQNPTDAQLLESWQSGSVNKPASADYRRKVRRLGGFAQ